MSLLRRPLSPVYALGTSPSRGSAPRQRFRIGAAITPHPLGAPLRGAVAERLRGRQSWTIAIRQKKLCTINHIVGDGLCAVPLCVLHSMKIDTPDQNNLSLRDQFANWSWQSASPLHSIKSTAVSKRNGLPRRFAPRNDRGFLYVAFSFFQRAISVHWCRWLRIAPP